MSDTVLCEIDGGIATLTLNRPDKLNAINYEMADRLLERLDEIELDPRVGAVILTGNYLNIRYERKRIALAGAAPVLDPAASVNGVDHPPR